MASLRVGLIGAGRNTRDRHIPGFRLIPDLEIVSVVNRSYESANAVATEFGIAKVADSVEQLLADPEVDAVCIGTWPYVHRDLTVAALEAGKHVLCEARMARDAPEAEQMLAASEAHPHLVAQLVPAPFDFRLGPTIRRMCEDGTLGAILEVHVRLLNGGGLDQESPLHWRHQEQLSGHNTMQLGIYNETLQRWLGDTRRVIADARVVVPSRVEPESGERVPIAIPDSLGVFADMANGARCTYAVSSVAGGGDRDSAGTIDIYGSEGRLHWRAGDKAEWGLHRQDLRPLTPDPRTDHEWQVEDDFVQSIWRGKAVTLTNFRDGVRYMRFTDAVWKSWNEGVAVEVEPLAD